jgi:TPR repeat protein
MTEIIPSMSKRVAFLIGNQRFQPDSGLLPLKGPVNDVAALTRLLRDPQRGRFEVVELLDQSSYDILPNIDRALSKAAPNDLVLIYYSGHGKLDRHGRLCLATANTSQSALLATSIPTSHLSELVEHSDCNQVVLLLDCCYSGAVGVRGDVESELRVAEGAHGFYILTATSEMESAREEETATGGRVMGRFTAAIVSGVDTGSADLSGNGMIVLSDLRRHVEGAVSGQRPKFFARNASGDPLISFSPTTARPHIDSGILADLNDPQWHRRRGAVAALMDLVRGNDAIIARDVRAALQGRLQHERDYLVRREIETALGPGESDEWVGGGLPKDDTQAAKLFKLASDQGNADAQAKLGVFFRDGRGGLPKDDTQAAQLFKLAADQGNADAQINLGVFFRDGRGGLPKDDTQAAQLFKLAADQENADAQINLGVFFRDGRGGLPKNNAQAAQLFKLAANQGNALGQFYLGWIYENGRRGLPKDDTQAARLYKLAADQGNADALANLGSLYEGGRGGLPKDDTEAARLYKLAVDQGNAYAEIRLPLLKQRLGITRVTGSN